MPTITIGRMSKKINSMRRTFDENSTVDVSVKLKEKTTEHDPVFILQGLPLDNDYNYCKWGRRRYWINKKVYVTNDIMEFYCNLDPLATFHDSILDSTGFCSFADKEHWNDLLDDPRFGAEIEIPGNKATWIWPIANTISYNSPDHQEESWTVVFRTLAMVENVQAKPSIYVMSLVRFWSVLAKIGDDITSGWTGNPTYDVSNALQKLMGGDPMDTILSVYVLPISISLYKEMTKVPEISDYWEETTKMVMGTFNPIDIGSASSEIEKVWTTRFLEQIDPIKVSGWATLSWPDGTENYRFLRYPKYTSLQLRYPNGVQEINDNKLATNLKDVGGGVYADVIYYKMVMHPWTGEYFLYLLSGEESLEKPHEVLASTHGMCGMSLMDYISISDSNYSAGDMLTGLVRKIPSVLASYAVPAGSAVSTTTIEGGATTTFESWEGTSGGMFNDPYSGHSGTRKVVEPRNISKSNTYYNNGIHGLFQAFGGQSGTPHDATLPAGIFAAFLQPKHVVNILNQNREMRCAVIVSSIVAPRIFTKYNSQTQEIEFDDENYVNHCEEYGWPCNKRLKLGDIGNTPTERGKDHYVKCEGFSWTPQNLVHQELDPLSANAEDIAFVNNMINSGIYITHDDLLE